MRTLAVVVLSGGLDSATALGLAVERHAEGDVHAISFDYGQKHRRELKAARNLATHYAVEWTLVELPTNLFRGGVLTTEEEVQDMRYDDLPSGIMSPTYVPFRNGNLLAQSVAYADSVIRETEKFMDGEHKREVPANPWDSALVYAGMHAEDAAGFAYADCTPEFLGAMAAAIHIGTYGRVRLQAVFQFLKKAEIIELGQYLHVPYDLTFSCYRGGLIHCGQCSTCYARKEAFDVAGVQDPVEYAHA